MTKSPSSTRFKKLTATINGYDIFDPDNNVDSSLRAKLSSEGYDKLNEIIRSNVIQIYKERMTPFCEELNENARIIDQDINSNSKVNISFTQDKEEEETISNVDNQQVLNGNWRKDPKNMTNNEILDEILKLEVAFEKQRKLNQDMRSEIEIIRLAAKRMELEKNGLYLELKKKETGFTD